MSERPIRCVGCRAKANVEVRGNTPVNVMCPRCGESQTYSEFQRSVGEQATAYAQETIGKSFTKMARSNNNITYKPARIRKSKPKFTVGF